MENNERRRRKRRKTKKPSNRFTNLVYFIICLLAAVVFIGYLTQQVGRYNSLRSEHARIEARLAHEQALHADLYYQLSNFCSYAYIERLAREQLGWVRQNEIVFRNIAE